MVRLLLCLLVLGSSSAVLLVLRQQRNAIRHDCDVIHSRMIEVQRELWRQQTQVAIATAPAALDATLAQHIERARRNDRVTQQSSLNAATANDEWSATWGDLPDGLDDQVEGWEDLFDE